MKTVRLLAGKEKSLLRKHPWVFSGAIAEIKGLPDDGETVKVVSADHTFLGWGAFSAQSQIRVRIWSWDESVQVGKDFITERLRVAISARMEWLNSESTNAFRLVHAESDSLPGLIVDRYNE